MNKVVLKTMTIVKSHLASKNSVHHPNGVKEGMSQKSTCVVLRFTAYAEGKDGNE